MQKVKARKRQVRPTMSKGPPCRMYSGEWSQMYHDTTTEKTMMGMRT
jgi:hypothetical protein